MADRECIDSVSGEWDEDGFYLRFQTDEGERVFWLTDTATARELMRAVAPLLGWIVDEDRERAAYDRASPEERARVLGRTPAEVELDELQREQADLARKRERENPS